MTEMYKGKASDMLTKNERQSEFCIQSCIWLGSAYAFF